MDETMFIEALGIAALNGYVRDVEHTIALCKEAYRDNYNINLAIANVIYRQTRPTYSGNHFFPLNTLPTKSPDLTLFQFKTRLMFAIFTNNVQRVEFLLKYCKKEVLNTLVPNRTIYQHFLFNTKVAINNPPSISSTGLYWLSMMETFSPIINRTTIETVKYTEPFTGRVYCINYVIDDNVTDDTVVPKLTYNNDDTDTTTPTSWNSAFPLSPLSNASSSLSLSTLTSGVTDNHNTNNNDDDTLLSPPTNVPLPSNLPTVTIHIPPSTNFAGYYRRIYNDTLEILINQWPNIGIVSFGSSNGNCTNNLKNVSPISTPPSGFSVPSLSSVSPSSSSSSTSSSSLSSTVTNPFTLSSSSSIFPTIEYVLMGPPSTPYAGVPIRFVIEYTLSNNGLLFHIHRISTLNYVYHPYIRFDPVTKGGILSVNNPFVIPHPLGYGETMISNLLNQFLQSCHIYGESTLIRGEEGAILRNPFTATSTTTITTTISSPPSHDFDIVDTVADTVLQENRSEFTRLVSQSIQRYGKIPNRTLKETYELFLLPYCNPLHYCVYHNQLSLVQLLIRAGADVELPTYYGDTPLVLALRHGDLAMVTYLLEHGKANSLIRNGRGEDCLFDAQSWEFLDDHTLPSENQEKFRQHRQELVRVLQQYRSLRKNSFVKKE